MIFIRKLFIRTRGARNTIDQNLIRITFNNQPKIKVILMIYEAHHTAKLRTQLKNLKVSDMEAKKTLQPSHVDQGSEISLSAL